VRPELLRELERAVRADAAVARYVDEADRLDATADDIGRRADQRERRELLRAGGVGRARGVGSLRSEESGGQPGGSTSLDHAASGVAEHAPGREQRDGPARLRASVPR
jgi:hypothetical protein